MKSYSGGKKFSDTLKIHALWNMMVRYLWANLCLSLIRGFLTDLKLWSKGGRVQSRRNTTHQFGLTSAAEATVMSFVSFSCMWIRMRSTLRPQILVCLPSCWLVFLQSGSNCWRLSDSNCSLPAAQFCSGLCFRHFSLKNCQMGKFYSDMKHGNKKLCLLEHRWPNGLGCTHKVCTSSGWIGFKSNL